MRAKGQAAMVAKIVVSVLMVASAITISSNSLSSVFSSQTEQSEKTWLQENIRDPTRVICQGGSSDYPQNGNFVERDISIDGIETQKSSGAGNTNDWKIEFKNSDKNKYVLQIENVNCKITTNFVSEGSGLTKKFRVEQVGSGTENEAKITVKGSG